MRFVTKTNTLICTGYFLMRFIVHNEFHESLRVGFSSGRLDKGLGPKFTLTKQSIAPRFWHSY